MGVTITDNYYEKQAYECFTTIKRTSDRVLFNICPEFIGVTDENSTTYIPFRSGRKGPSTIQSPGYIWQNDVLDRKDLYTFLRNSYIRDADIINHSIRLLETEKLGLN
jgi:hypothetical protein